MKIMITGVRGQLGQQIMKVLATGHEILALDRDNLNIACRDELLQKVSDFAPEVLINAAAYTHVDEAELEPDEAHAVNALALVHLAAICTDHNVLLVHFSTDYVFGEDRGKGDEPYHEGDEPGPLNVYGRSKLAGEGAVLESQGRNLVLRTSWLYGQGRNFLDTMLKKVGQGDVIKVVNDQIGSPTSACELARVTAFLLALYESGELDVKDGYGIYHASCGGQTSWYGFARKIFEISGSTQELRPVRTEDYSSLAERPSYSVLANQRLEKLWGYKMKHWEEALEEHMKERMNI